MELTEKERLMLVSKKEEILKLTKEILDVLKDPAQAIEVKKRMTSILSLVSTIASYAESKNYNLDALMGITSVISLQMDLLGKNWTSLGAWIEVFCNAVNSIQFNFTKRDIIIRIPKIDLSIFKQSRG
ncbi:MAG: hypothetical protein ABSF24_10880 [Candidatus Bathyarchaeia archaeon]|jgi:hypothetical protein